MGARMLNIDYGRNRELMEKCKPLREYTIFVDKIKRYIKEKKNIKEAAEQAIDECIKEDVLAEFLRIHRAEVKDVCITEYNEERVMDAIRTEGYEEGRSMGLQEGQDKERIHGIRNLIQVALDLGADMEVAVTKAAEQYQEPKQQIWDIWENRE